MFQRLAFEDTEFCKGEPDDAPDFGDSQSSYEDVVHNFYGYWQSYSTRRSYAWLDPFDIRETPNRRVLRLVEKENKKVRDKAKRERNEQVRNLVAFVRKRDKRVHVHAQKLAERARENARKVQERKQQQLLDRQKELQEHKVSEWSKFHNIESELKSIEADLAAEFGEELSSDDDSQIQDPNALYCVACNKLFKTHKAFANHENSKKHRDSLAAMKAALIQEDSEYASDSDDGDVEDDSKIQGGATGPEIPDFLLDPPAASSANGSKTSDAELNSDQSSNGERKGGSSTDAKGADMMSSGKATMENDYDAGTSEDELISDEEEDGPAILLRSKKQKKKKRRSIQTPIMKPNTDEEEQDFDLRMGLSKKQRKKQQQQLQGKMVFKIGEGVLVPPKGDEEQKENFLGLNKDSNEDLSKVEEDNDDSYQEASTAPIKRKGKKAKELRKAQRQVLNEDKAKREELRDELPDVDHMCMSCKDSFSSKNKLFEHLKKTGHSLCLQNVLKVKKKADTGRTVKGKGKSSKNSDC